MESPSRASERRRGGGPPNLHLSRKTYSSLAKMQPDASPDWTSWAITAIYISITLGPEGLGCGGFDRDGFYYHTIIESRAPSDRRQERGNPSAVLSAPAPWNLAGGKNKAAS